MLTASFWWTFYETNGVDMCAILLELAFSRGPAGGRYLIGIALEGSWSDVDGHCNDQSSHANSCIHF